ncbi:factor associated with metabolism and energy isoform X4 [Canis lupus baileyi]|uniref:factor associated with metabolism and energy isoform X4 n=1 Tax=Canis lupus baileyi TaxID=143281 RepID=UPI003B96BE2F
MTFSMEASGPQPRKSSESLEIYSKETTEKLDLTEIKTCSAKRQCQENKKASREDKRWQKLEPIDLPQVITSEMLLSQQEGRTTHRAKELEKKMQTPGYTPGKRQYLHKMRMLEMNRNRQEAQAELKKSLHREARINQKPRDHKAKKILQSIPRNPRNDDGDLPILLPDETLNRRSPGNLQNEDFGEYQAMNDYCPQKIGKMETWLREQEAQGQLLWDSSSSDSEELKKSEKKPQALVRTRTERIPLFDEFFD